MQKGYKVCGICRKSKPLDEYNKGSLFGTRLHKCKQCQSDYNIAYRERRKTLQK